jgi:hypothetical protein
MAAKKDDKKEEKPFVDPFSLMKTEDLIKHYDKHYAQTKEDADRRAGYEHEKKNYLDIFSDIQTSYLLAKRGASDKSPNKPKRHAFTKDTRNLESAELLNKLVLSLIEHYTKDDKGNVNKAILDYYKKNPEQLRNYAMGMGLDYDKTKQDLIAHYRNINSSEAFEKFKDAMAGSLIKDLEKLDRVGNELKYNISHHNKLKSHVKSALEKQGLTLEETVGAPEALGHYENLLSQGGTLSADYTLKHEASLKKYEKPKK